MLDLHSYYHISGRDPAAAAEHAVRPQRRLLELHHLPRRRERHRVHPPAWVDGEHVQRQRQAGDHARPPPLVVERLHHVVHREPTGARRARRPRHRRRLRAHVAGAGLLPQRRAALLQRGVGDDVSVATREVGLDGALVEGADEARVVAANLHLRADREQQRLIL
ncbi:Os11g0302750, partial [Oryza sativa Japonica Group]